MSIAFGRRRAEWIRLTDGPPPLTPGELVHFETTDLFYRSLCALLYNYVPTSGHPGGLCLMAIPYNLMHILIEDGVAEPGNWWYASPWYIPQQGKISAKRG